MSEATEFSESEMSDYLSEGEDEEESDYEKYDDRSIKDALASKNSKPLYANKWESTPPRTLPVFEFSGNAGPIAQFTKEKDAFSAMVSDEMINM